MNLTLDEPYKDTGMEDLRFDRRPLCRPSILTYRHSPPTSRIDRSRRGGVNGANTWPQRASEMITICLVCRMQK
jgi:hypothetical protein